MKPKLVPIQVKVCRRCGAETPMFGGPLRHFKECPRPHVQEFKPKA